MATVYSPWLTVPHEPGPATLRRVYQALLTRRYLTSKIVPLVGVFAVTLCSAMVLIVWSIMGGFLVMLLSIGRDMEGDVTIAWPTVGFAHYERLIERLEADPMVAAACPMIETFGIVKLPDTRQPGAQIKGVDERFARVTGFERGVWWRPIDRPEPRDKARLDPRLAEHGFHELFEANFRDALRLRKRDNRTGELVPAAVLGIELSGFSVRRPEGFYTPAGGIGVRQPGGSFEWIPGFILGHSVTITVLPLTEGTQALGLTQRVFPVANEFRTGLFEADKSTVLLELSELQRMLKMDAWERTRPVEIDAAKSPYDVGVDDDGRESAGPRTETVGVEPARVTHVLVKSAPGFGPEQLRERCVEIYRAFAAEFPGEVPDPSAMADSRTITTFEMQRGTFINAVKQETALVLFLLIVISFVAACLILSIFWAMVSEKTRDIGTLRAVGASRLGIAWLWLRYGAAIGLVGGLLGLGAATLIVWNINPIHEWMGRALRITIWDPKVYYFPTIPNKVQPWQAGVVFSGALLFSLFGALIPAVRAARMDPVKALRFE
ncbi:MAG: ABC transporter permease [Phycisphaeraceae bacterium]|nr:ABC transporter permease [Phycisphaeraceae bacterium]